MKNTFLALVLLLGTQSLAAPQYRSLQTASDSEPETQYHLSAETVITYAERDAYFPAFGLSFFKTVEDEGMFYDGGLYVIPELERVPVYIHLGYQFSPHYRLSGILGGTTLGGEFEDVPILITAAEFEWVPVNTKDFEFSLLPGVGSVYFVVAPTLYVGSRVIARLVGPISFHATVRTFPTHDFVLFGSAGLRISL